MKIGSAQFPPIEITSENFGRDLNLFLQPELLEYLESISPLFGQLNGLAEDYTRAFRREATSIHQWFRGDSEGKDKFLVSAVQECLKVRPNALDRIRDRARFLAESRVREPMDKVTTQLMALVSHLFDDQTGELLDDLPPLPELPEQPEIEPLARFTLETWIWPDQETCFTTRVEQLDERMVCAVPGEPPLLFEENSPIILHHLESLGADPNWGLFFRQNMPGGESSWTEIKAGPPQMPDGVELSIACLWSILSNVGNDWTSGEISRLPRPATDRLTADEVRKVALSALPADLDIALRMIRFYEDRDKKEKI